MTQSELGTIFFVTYLFFTIIPYLLTLLVSNKHVLESMRNAITSNDMVTYIYSWHGKFMPLPLKSKILETPESLVTDDIKVFPL